MQNCRSSCGGEKWFPAVSDLWTPLRSVSDTLNRMKRPCRVVAAQSVAATPGEFESNSGGSGSPDRGLPVIDLDVLSDLEEQLGDASLARSFAEDFLGATAARIGRLETAVVGKDAEAAMDAILGVKTTSMMVGAVALARLATQCESALHRDDVGELAVLVPALRQCSERTARLLQETYLPS